MQDAVSAPGESRSSEPAGQLLRLWNQYADCLKDGDAGKRIRTQIVEPFGRVSGSQPQQWLLQAQLLATFDRIREQWTRDNSKESNATAQLRHACDEMLRRIDGEQRAVRPRLFGLLEPPREWQALLADVTGLLRRCRASFDQIMREQVVWTGPGGNELRDVETSIEIALTTFSANWPPARILQFHRQLCVQGLIASEEYLQGAAGLLESAGEWREMLHTNLPDEPADTVDALLMLRAILESLVRYSVQNSAWPALVLLAKDLIPRQRLAIELIREAKQPLDWFEPPIEADVKSPEVTQPGWALRIANRPWFCFPKARLRVPPPKVQTPASRAVEKMIDLTAKHGWLTPLTSVVAVLSETPESASRQQAVQAILPVLDHLVDTVVETLQSSDAAVSFTNLAQSQAIVLDQVISEIRVFSDNFQCHVLPREWTFTKPVAHGDLSADDVLFAYFFRTDEPSGSVYRIRQFGLRTTEELMRPAVASVSAGPAPQGFAELEELIKEPVDENQAVLLDRLRSWREAKFRGALELVAVQFFVDFWGELGEDMRQSHPDLAHQFTMRLYDMLKHEWNLHPFFPVAYQDHPDGWLQRVGGKSMVSGRVRRVIRPGLQDEHGELRLPALVDVE